MTGILFTIERRKPVNQGGRVDGVTVHTTTASALAELASCARRLQKRELGSVKLTGHQYPPFSHSAYFADDIVALIEALKESAR